jgi:hypothetical protein
MPRRLSWARRNSVFANVVVQMLRNPTLYGSLRATKVDGFPDIAAMAKLTISMLDVCFPRCRPCPLQRPES